MTKPLSLDLRQRVIAAIEAGMSCRAAAARFGIAPSAAVKWRRLWLETGSVVPRAQGGVTRSCRIEAAGPAILAMVAETRDITLVEIAERLERGHGEQFAPSTVHRFFRRHGWSFKNVWPALSARVFVLGSSVCANVSGIGAVLPAQMELRAIWSSQKFRRLGAIF